MADGSKSAQITMPRKVRPFRVADLFCGAGGSSTGAFRALRELGIPMELVAVNHWPIAVETHTRNHPDAAHHCVDLEHAKPRDLVPGGVLDLLIASPACTYHSRARGGRPVHDQQRMDPWHVVRWCTELRVKRLLVENVPEYADWGPCHATTGRPLQKRKGEYFRAWCAALRAIGMRIEVRVINCADHGDATTRRRLFVIGRSDGRPLTWPEATHDRTAWTDMLSSREQWRGATEIIDWTRPGSSIFTRKRPLKPNTLRRILAGAERYAWPRPYVDAIRALLEGREPVLDVPAEGAEPMLVHFRGTSDSALARTALQVGAPLPTLTAGGEHLGLVMAVGSTGAARPIAEPLPTLVTTASPHYITPLIVNRCNSDGGRTARPVAEPCPTACTSGAGYLAEPLIAPYYGSGSGVTCISALAPLPAATTKPRFALAEALVVSTSNSSAAGIPRPASEPLRTITTARGGDMAVAAPAVAGVRIDIHYRMLHWRELARSMSFDDEGQVYDFAGTQEEITKQIGNAVPGRTAKALVRALVQS